jgi:hypothetical protein
MPPVPSTEGEWIEGHSVRWTLAAHQGERLHEAAPEGDQRDSRDEVALRETRQGIGMCAASAGFAGPMSR